MSIRQFFLAAGTAWVLSPLCAQTLPPDPASISLAQALQAAHGNLDVALARSALSAAQADVESANHAPLPVLSGKLAGMDLQHGIGSGNALTKKRIDKSLGIDWTWERGNKRALRTESAQQNAQAAQADVQETITQQLQATYAAFFELLAAQEREAQITALAASAEQLASIANRRVQAGDLSAQDAARTEIEAQRAHADLAQAALERRRAALSLQQLTGWTFPADSLQVQAQWPASSPVADTLPNASAGVQQRPDVRAAQARVQAAQAALDHASALKKSDVTVGASVDHYPGTSTRLLEVRLQMPLQWGYEYQGEIGRAQAQLSQAQDLYAKVLLSANTEMQQLQLQALASSERAQRYQNHILPRARRVAEGAELAYQRGAMPLTDLLDARRTLRTTLMEASSAQADAAKALGAWQLRSQPQALLSPLSVPESLQ